jgi:FKBP-type peptidyl-prolyl cis-trans isomerase FkpA
MKKQRIPIVLSVVAALAGACGGDGSSTSPTPLPTAPFSQTDLSVGTGADSTVGRRLTVYYTLWLYDPAQAEGKGRQLETNVGGAPFPFTLGAGEVIRGWDQGFVGMKAGGRRRLVIPPELAYGAAGRGSVPPSATLVFDVELLSVQ